LNFEKADKDESKHMRMKLSMIVICMLSPINIFSQPPKIQSRYNIDFIHLAILCIEAQEKYVYLANTDSIPGLAAL
jgi:hypothetical protein